MNESLLRDAYGHHRKGNLVEAARLYGEVLRADPQQLDALSMMGLLHLQRGDLPKANDAANEAIRKGGGTDTALYNLGCLLQNLGRHAEAVAIFDKAVGTNTNSLQAFAQRGISQLALNDHHGALASFDAALRIRPGDTVASNNRGAALLLLGRFEEAAGVCDAVLAQQPRNTLALLNRGIAYARLHRNADALASFAKALAIDPLHSGALLHRAIVLMRLQRHEDALQSLDRCLAVKPKHIEALTCRAVALKSLGRIEDALLSCDAALAIRPDFVEALINRATLLSLLNRYEDAARDAERALALAPGLAYGLGKLAFYKLHVCDWHDIEALRTHIATGLSEGKRVIYPFSNVSLSRSPADQLACAKIYAADEFPASPVPLWRGERYVHKRIRLAYVSADFRVHPMSQLMAGVFESHDRERFETIAISLGPDDKSVMRTRLEKSFHRFIDVRTQGDGDIARLLRESEADIAVDLMGFTTNSRSGIFAARPAPLCVNYLGFPGTMGNPCYDYLIADTIVIPQEHRPFYSEEIAFLPDCYLPNDSSRANDARTPTREESGLPESGFVFACFNGSYKLAPETFAIWMRLLSAVDGSVLWLTENNQAAVRNLREQAEARGIAAERLVFAPHLASADDHLARLRLADLFLDTLPFNAHTTACDALWAGLPLITCVGTTFAGRVAASLLHAIGLPELITHSAEEFEALALKLARDAPALAAFKAKLAKNRHTYPLFDTKRFTRNLESAFTAMWDRHQHGLPPESFAVEDVAGAPGHLS